ncbi:MAG: hypothetical protein AB1600_01820 [Bacteroidota bacterium]
MIAASLNKITQAAHQFPEVRKNELRHGDCAIIRTVKSTYTLRVLAGGLYEASGGWFDKKGCSKMKIGVAGATWGGSAIIPAVLAACGMRIEFMNKLITSPVQKIVIIPANVLN